jgi:nitrate/nitrite-specific signal transduction histidine kinase
VELLGYILISFLLECTKTMLALASKKGVALTVGIAAAIIGSSFLIWYIPQGSSPDVPRTDGEVISDIYARHNNLASDVDLRFEQWKDNDTAPADMSAQLSSTKSQIEEMRQQLDNRQPAQEWQESYDIYVQSLDAYVAYLDALAQKVANGDRTNPDPVLYENWQNLIDRSVAAMPINN